MTSWLDTEVSLYTTYADNVGRSATFRDILFTEFWRDLDSLVDIRSLDKEDPDYKKKKTDLKARLQCFTPAALLACKAKGNVIELSRSGIMQLDFDYEQIKDFDIEELKKYIFELPFVGFCGKSPSGDGFYALISISEPHRLAEYAEHCFNILSAHGIEADRSKGKKPENLRYVSYDKNMLIREFPEQLRIRRFKAKLQPQKTHHQSGQKTFVSNSGLVSSQLAKVQQAQVGQRWATIQQVAYTLGGIGQPDLLDQIIQQIEMCSAFEGEVAKYTKCAADCFKGGSLKPIS